MAIDSLLYYCLLLASESPHKVQFSSDGLKVSQALGLADNGSKLLMQKTFQEDEEIEKEGGKTKTKKQNKYDM